MKIVLAYPPELPGVSVHLLTIGIIIELEIDKPCGNGVLRSVVSEELGAIEVIVVVVIIIIVTIVVVIIIVNRISDVERCCTVNIDMATEIETHFE